MFSKVTVALMVVCLVVGIGLGYGITFALYLPQLEAVRSDVSKVQAENAKLSQELTALSGEINRAGGGVNRSTTTGEPLASWVYETAKPGVVSITVYDQSDVAVAIASGFVYGTDHIVTNSHVAEAGVSYLVTFLDGSQVKASLAGNDPQGDLAVLSAPLTAYARPLEIADSNKLKIGEPVFAIGSPVGLTGSITSGIVSQVNRTVPDVSFLFYIQTDAPINPGNSGGPLLNSDAQVIGVNTFGASKNVTEGLGFAIPSNIVARVVPKLIETGSYEYPLMGITGTFLDPIQAESLNLPETVTSGWMVEQIMPGTGAASSLRINDIILSINNFTVRYEHDISYIMNQFFSPGDKVTLKVLRGGQTLDVDLILSSRS